MSCGFQIDKITTDPTQNNPKIKTTTSEPNENPNIRDAIAIDIGTSKCKIAICKDKHIQIVEHGIYSQISELIKEVSESTRSVPSYVAYSEQGEWLFGKEAENYAICLQNVIYGYFKYPTCLLKNVCRYSLAFGKDK